MYRDIFVEFPLLLARFYGLLNSRTDLCFTSHTAVNDVGTFGSVS